jgi:REP element-mobilizing transposase RayT
MSIARTEGAGAIHHVWARGAVKQTIFVDDVDRRRYLGYFAQVIRRQRWRSLGYCLMGNHLHLLVETPAPNLGSGMHRLHGAYAQTFNRRHRKSGHVFDRPYGANLIETDVELWVIASYIANNPVVAGLSPTPDAWPWSSHASLSARKPDACVDKGRLCWFFGSMGGDPQRRYLEYVTADSKARLNRLAV